MYSPHKRVFTKCFAYQRWEIILFHRNLHLPNVFKVVYILGIGKVELCEYEDYNGKKCCLLLTDNNTETEARLLNKYQLTCNNETLLFTNSWLCSLSQTKHLLWVLHVLSLINLYTDLLQHFMFRTICVMKFFNFINP